MCSGAKTAGESVPVVTVTNAYIAARLPGSAAAAAAAPAGD